MMTSTEYATTTGPAGEVEFEPPEGGPSTAATTTTTRRPRPKPKPRRPPKSRRRRPKKKPRRRPVTRPPPTHAPTLPPTTRAPTPAPTTRPPTPVPTLAPTPAPTVRTPAPTTRAPAPAPAAALPAYSAGSNGAVVDVKVVNYATPAPTTKSPNTYMYNAHSCPKMDVATWENEVVIYDNKNCAIIIRMNPRLRRPTVTFQAPYW